MAGHSKWANIQHRKGAQDKKRAAIFAKLAKEITVAAKMGGDDMEANPRLRLAVTNARGFSMPKDNIERAIKKGAGIGIDNGNYEEIRYEGYGTGGIAILIEVLTDNRNRSASDVRSMFSKFGGNLGEAGSVSFLFEKQGKITLGRDACHSEALLDAVLQAGGSDVEVVNDIYVVTCEPQDVHAISTALTEQFGQVRSAETLWVANNTITLDKEKAGKIFTLVGALEDLEDVQNVYTNMSTKDVADT